MITCGEVTRRLDDFIDEALPAAERDAVAGHIDSCAACRAELTAQRSLLAAAAALPREVAPDRDLWPAIAVRLRAQGGSHAVGRARPWILLPAAAAIIVTLGALVATRARWWPGSAENGQRGDLRAATSEWPPGTLAQAEAEYERAAQALALALEKERSALPPETVAAVERNVKVIDQALAEVREARRREPGNPLWADLLVATHRQKVDVLSRAHRLSTSL
jgi:hypothetical protein